MTSCGTEVDREAVMRGKPKFDRSNMCIKCKIERGNIVVRHSVYCKGCFFTFVITKFRRCLDPCINEESSGSRRSALKASGNLIIGFSGGLGSTVLADIICKTYFTREEQDPGGKDHPRNKHAWAQGYACHVDISGAFPGMVDRTEDIRSTLSSWKALEFVSVRIEEAFDSKWWEGIRVQDFPSLNIDLADDDLPLVLQNTISSQVPGEEPIGLLRAYLASLPTPTAVQSAITSLIRLLLSYTAHRLHCSHLALGTSLTSLSISLISTISQGGGFNVPEETYEEWKMHSENAKIRIVRPLRDVGMKECAAWAWWKTIRVIGKDRPTSWQSSKQTIMGLTKTFIVGLERDYPSTVSTIARTCMKVTPKVVADGRCVLCERPFPTGVLQWKSNISISSKSDLPSEKSNMSIRNSLVSAHKEQSTTLSPHICYACHTMLTSTSPRFTQKPTSNLLRPPMWTPSNLTYTQEEAHRTNRTSHDESKAVISKFLLEDD